MTLNRAAISGLLLLLIGGCVAIGVYADHILPGGVEIDSLLERLV